MPTRPSSGLEISAGSLAPAFYSGTTSYTASVANNVANVTVTPTTNHTGATVTVDGSTVTSGNASADIALTENAITTITVVVVAQDGSTEKTTTIDVTRAASADAALSGTGDFGGQPGPGLLLRYHQLHRCGGERRGERDGDPDHEPHRRRGDGQRQYGDQRQRQRRHRPDRKCHHHHHCGGGGPGRVHRATTIDVTRAASADAALSGLAISAGGLAPVFSSDTTSYTAAVANDVASVTVTPTTSHTGAAVTVNGSTVTSASADIALTENATTTITVVVTAQDGSTEKTTTVAVTRAASDANNDATLSALTLSPDALNETFAPGTTSYSADVANNVASLTLTASPTDDAATLTLTVDGTVVTSASGSASANIALTENATTTIVVTVTAEDGTTTGTTTVAVTRAASADAALSGLEISAGSLAPVFSSDTTSYTASVANDVASVTVTPTTSHTGAAVTVNGSAVTSASASADIALTENAITTITVVVTAQDGTTQQTTIAVTRAANADAALFNLEISAGSLAPAFYSGTTSYTASVANNVANVTVTPTTNHTGATVTVDGSTVTSGNASADIALTENAITTITVVVTAQDGTTQQTTIAVTRVASDANNDATLSALTLSPDALNETFATDTISYTASVANNVAKVTVTASPSDDAATLTLKVDDTVLASASGSASANIALTENATTTIVITVTAEDGETTATYTVAVTRAASADATLFNLEISAGSLAPAFYSGTTSYTASVANNVANVTVTPTTNHTGATVTVDGSTVTSGNASADIALTENAITTITVVVTAQDGDNPADHHRGDAGGERRQQRRDPLGADSLAGCAERDLCDGHHQLHRFGGEQRGEGDGDGESE